VRRVDPFLVLLLGAAVLGSLLPATGTAFDVVRWASTIGIGLLFFLYGARLSTAETVRNLRHWRLQLSILSVTFVVFPLMGLATRLLPDSWLAPQLAAGLLLLTLVPSTVQGCVVYTRIARGNVAAAVVSASTSNLLGVLLTPLLVALLLGGEASVDAGSVVRIVLQLLAPFALGQLLRPVVGAWVQRHDTGLKRFDRSTILLIVYVAFSEGTEAGIWSAVPLHDLLVVVLLAATLLALGLAWCALWGRAVGFDRGDRVALLFCGSNKSLASGLPMATVLFPSDVVAFVVLPLMAYHQLQLVVGSVLSSRLARSGPAD
jgi:sodium/bile acid cotransporter 7